MNRQAYIQLSDNQIKKVGNALVYLINNVGHLSKTKALKLIYILDELSIKRSGIPFFNLTYKVWKFGPVSEELFIDLSSDTTMLKDYITKGHGEDYTRLITQATFSDDEFSDNDIDLLDYVIEKFGGKSAKELISYTHRKKSPWYQSASQHGVLELLEGEKINNTELVIDLSALIEHDERKKALYDDFMEYH